LPIHPDSSERLRLHRISAFIRGLRLSYGHCDCQAIVKGKKAWTIDGSLTGFALLPHGRGFMSFTPTLFRGKRILSSLVQYVAFFVAEHPGAPPHPAVMLFSLSFSWIVKIAAGVILEGDCLDHRLPVYPARMRLFSPVNVAGHQKDG